MNNNIFTISKDANVNYLATNGKEAEQHGRGEVDIEEVS